MTADQLVLFAILAVAMAFFLWGRIRYDIVALSALAIGVATGIVPVQQTFAGFGHQATMIVVVVLIVSAGLTRSGAMIWLTRALASKNRPVMVQIVIMGTTAAIMSAFMNNIAALALLMPIDIQAARKAGRPPGQTLMPLAFASMLGGVMTMIGTPPNIIVSTFRADQTGEAFRMFDYTLHGGVVAIAGLAFVTLIGWRLLPLRKGAEQSGTAQLEGFISELVIPEDSKLEGQRVRDIEAKAERADLAILSVLRDRKRRHGPARNLKLRGGDVLVVSGASEGLEEFRAGLKLKFHDKKTSDNSDKEGTDKTAGKKDRSIDTAIGAGMVMIEVAVPHDARIVGKTAQSIGLSWRQQAILVGLSRQGRNIRDRIRRSVIHPGDILLLLVPEETRTEVAEWLGGIVLTGREKAVIHVWKTAIAIGLFAAAVLAASVELLPLPVALVFVIIGYALSRILPLDELYSHVNWPVVVLLGALIPLGMALETTGGAALIADGLMYLARDLPPWAALALIMAVVMTMSDILNNNATTVLAAPVVYRLAELMEVNPDPFLMGLALSASCAFLTPIGHQNNTVVMGPGGYRFSDYWRMGLPLEIIIIAVGVPMILLVWPV
ncbi:SLC13 family permease [Alkalilacustris brevis]|uniref:SLC13 family permease n=1 Tax=Alkalilacustris brevis TaxID=2026338 RepID=UPI000E0DCF52|nr:SLC13 family permease [Alkalilacustris brevis]